MPSEAKREAVAELTELLSASPTTIITDYRGLSVSEIGAVRRTLREQGITFRVVKNRLAKIAAGQAGAAELGDLLEGPSAVAVGGGDEASIARVLVDALRPYRTVEVRGAVIRGQRVDGAAVNRLATLPSREVLLAQLAGVMAAPLGRMAGLLAAPIRDLAGGLQQLADQKGDGPEAASGTG